MVRIISYVVIHLIDKFTWTWKAGLYDIKCYKTYNIEKVPVGNDRKMHNQKEISTPKAEVGKTKLTIRYS